MGRGKVPWFSHTKGRCDDMAGSRLFNQHFFITKFWFVLTSRKNIMN